MYELKNMYIIIFAYVCYQLHVISLQCKVQTQIMLLHIGMHIKYMNKSSEFNYLSLYLNVSVILLTLFPDGSERNRRVF